MPEARNHDLASVLRQFHRDSCYPDALPFEVDEAVARICALLSHPVAEGETGRTVELSGPTNPEAQEAQWLEYARRQHADMSRSEAEFIERIEAERRARAAGWAACREAAEREIQQVADDLQNRIERGDPRLALERKMTICILNGIRATIRSLPCAGQRGGETNRPREFLAWAVRTFGEVAREKGERVARFIEEAIELAHASGMNGHKIARILTRVYERPAGDLAKEIGQAQATLECLAENLGLSADALAQAEFERVQSIPQEEWDRRHAAKVALGIASGSSLPLPPNEGGGK
jgi:hypothetical protein